MNKFYSENQYFLKKLNADVRGFSLFDRIKNYQIQFKKDTRERLRNHFNKLENRWQKKEFYLEAMELLSEFEFHYLLLSIYFDEDAEYLLSELTPVLTRSIPPNYVDRYSLVNLLNNHSEKNNKIEAFLESLFRKTIDLLEINPKGRNEYSNPEVNQLSSWLFRTLKQENLQGEVAMILIHFNKFWQIHFNNPFNYTKGIVLLTKVENYISQISLIEIKVNLPQVIEQLKIETTELLPNTIPSPIFDSRDMAHIRDQHASTGYLKKLDDFTHVLNRVSLVFLDLTKKGLIDLFETSCSADDTFKSILSAEIHSRTKRGVLLTDEEIHYFSSKQIAKMKYSNNDVYQTIIRVNYIFH